MLCWMTHDGCVIYMWLWVSLSAPFELWMNPSARMDLLDLVPELVVSCAVHIKHLGAEMT